MSNPSHSPRTEAIMMEVEAVRRAYLNPDSLMADGVTPAYRRDVRRALAKRYNRLLEAYKLDGMGLDENVED